MRDAKQYIEAIKRGTDRDDKHACNLCGECYDCNPDAEPSELCSQCAQEAVALLPPLAALTAQLLAALKAVEWEGSLDRDMCPWCGGYPEEAGHTSDCQLHAAIVAGEGKE